MGLLLAGALGFSENESAFWDAVETNDSAVKVLGDETLRATMGELVATAPPHTRLQATTPAKTSPTVPRPTSPILGDPPPAPSLPA